jgi:hypothetical protein
MQFIKLFESFISPEDTTSSTPDLESELVVTDSIRKDEIEGFVPKQAQYAMLNPSGEFIEKIYKFEDVKFNDNTTNKVMMYWGEQGGWHPSSYNDRDSKDYKNLKNRKFLKIVE